MTIENDADAIIVGAGIGGLAAAFALRQAGREVVVLERAETLAPVGAGLTLWANALVALDRSRLADAVRALGQPQPSGAIYAWNGAPLVTLVRDEGTQHDGFALAIHRADLQRLLLEALPTGVVQLRQTCTGVAQDATGAQALLADGSRVRAAMLIGADGLRSVVRAQLWGEAPPVYAGYTSWRGVTHFAHDRLTPGETWGRGERFGQVALRDGRVYWFATANAPEGETEPPSVQKQALLARFAAWHAPVPALIATTDADAMLRTDVYDRAPLAHWSAGRITLLGDAAHPMTPNLGQGACQALEDAAVLGACVRAEQDVVAALQHYERRRVSRTSAIVLRSRAIGRVAQWQHPLACRLRDTVLRLTPASLQRREIERVTSYSV